MKSLVYVSLFILSVGVIDGTIVSADTKRFRSYSGGSESAHPKIIRSIEDAKSYKQEDMPDRATRARPIYEELNEDSHILSDTEIKKKVYVSRSGSAMAHPKVVIQK